jgi:hypothetical protein
VAQLHASSLVRSDEDDMEDEMMVEDMLVAPGSPVAPFASAPWAKPQQQQQQQQLSWAPVPTPAPTSAYTQPPFLQQQRAQEPPSLFTTTDPFYLALTQRSQASAPYFTHAHRGSVFQMDGGMVLVDR